MTFQYDTQGKENIKKFIDRLENFLKSRRILLNYEAKRSSSIPIYKQLHETLVSFFQVEHSKEETYANRHTKGELLLNYAKLIEDIVVRGRGSLEEPAETLTMHVRNLMRLSFKHFHFIDGIPELGTTPQVGMPQFITKTTEPSQERFIFVKSLNYKYEINEVVQYLEEVYFMLSQLLQIEIDKKNCYFNFAEENSKSDLYGVELINYIVEIQKGLKEVLNRGIDAECSEQVFDIINGVDEKASKSVDLSKIKKPKRHLLVVPQNKSQMVPRETTAPSSVPVGSPISREVNNRQTALKNTRLSNTSPLRSESTPARTADLRRSAHSSTLVASSASKETGKVRLAVEKTPYLPRVRQSQSRSVTKKRSSVVNLAQDSLNTRLPRPIGSIQHAPVESKNKFSTGVNKIKRQPTNSIPKQALDKVLKGYESTSFLAFLSTFWLFSFFISPQRSQAIIELNLLLKYKVISRQQVIEAISKDSDGRRRLSLFNKENNVVKNGSSTDEVIESLSLVFNK